ncbi:MAG: DEAD/DEAH box helicase [Clostridia bacterium]|nr:DEAD/DEAH box helicase [Clostridia bacterium]
MSTEDLLFNRFPPFIQDFIYRNSWESLRDIQLAAADVLFNTDDNLILCSGTASGKTEAAFFPLVTEMVEDPPPAVGVLYISPLKSLINDQFGRLETVLDGNIPVFHWHGDVAASHKNKFLKEPKGILQITPESLESILINRSNDVIRLFGGMIAVVIDEIHTLIGSDRGNQIICQLTRLSRLIGYHPRRIGLSATVGDMTDAIKWIGDGTGRRTQAPVLPKQKTVWKLRAEHFYIGKQENTLKQDRTVRPDTQALEALKDPAKKNEPQKIDAGYEYLYDRAVEKKSIVFSNSREETEYITATLRQIARNRGEEDIFLIHHGNLSASIREEAEEKLRSDGKYVTCATVTLELGIDIGRLERIVHLGSPNSVSAFLQRLGRSGRRGEPPEMFLVFREEEPVPDTPLPQLIPWELLRAISIIQLYTEERFIEPPSRKTMPLSLLFHQILSVLAASGELSPDRLAERILSMSPFEGVPDGIYHELVGSMLKNDYIEEMDEGGYIVGLKGERLLSSYKFYAVFKDTEDYSVKHGSEEIGTITTPPPIGDRFALAGRVWEVVDFDASRKLVYAEPVEGKMEISWPGDYGEIHTKIMKKMREVLDSDREYPYLSDNAKKRLADARSVARAAGITAYPIVSLGGIAKCVFPWLGTRSFRTLRKFVKENAGLIEASQVEFEGCCYITFNSELSCEEIGKRLARAAARGIDVRSLVSAKEYPIFEKYDPCVPAELLREAYAADRLRTDEVLEFAKEL